MRRALVVAIILAVTLATGAAGQTSSGLATGQPGPGFPDAQQEQTAEAPESHRSVMQELPGSMSVDAGIPHDLSPWGMYLAADIVVKSVMIGLVLASILTWMVFFAKSLELVLARRRLRLAADALSRASSLHDAIERLGFGEGPAALLVRAAHAEVRASADGRGARLEERIASRLDRIQAAAGRRMMKGTGILATIGSTAPFVGLFGTVWGIMNAFVGIAEAQTTNLAVVAPGIAEALLATAIGLVAAIPAVVIYNGFARSIAGYRAAVSDVAEAIRRLVSRDLDASPLRGRGVAE